MIVEKVVGLNFQQCMDQVINPAVHFAMKVVGLKIVVETVVNDRNVETSMYLLATYMPVYIMPVTYLSKYMFVSVSP